MSSDNPGRVLLAAYGTLMTGQINPLSRRAAARMKSLGPCRIPGAMHEIHAGSPNGGFVYPALVIPDGENGMVHGEAFEIGADDAEAGPVLMETDRYEDYRPHDPAGSTYLRRSLPIRIAGRDGTDAAWVYVYNRPLAGARRIADGRWRAPANPLRFASARPEHGA